MAAALKRFYRGDNAVRDHELEIFRQCSDKIGKILRLTSNSEANVTELRQLSLSKGGLFNGPMRRWAWPALLQVPTEGSDATAPALSRDDLDLIEKDVQRSGLFRSRAVEGCIARGEQQSDLLQTKLISVLSAAVSSPLATGEDEPCYYQGLHDIAFILLVNLNYDEDKTTRALRKLMQSHLQDATKKDFSNITFVLDTVLMPLIQSLDEEVYMALVASDVPLTNVILPWLITLFAHPVQDESVASRLMDAFVANGHPMLPFYVAVALLTHPSLRSQILAASCDPAMMHMAIQALPSQLKNDLEMSGGGKGGITAQDIIDLSLSIMQEKTPESLLQFIGMGLGQRSRRRLLKKARCISMLGIPARQSRLSAQADLFWKTQAQVRSNAKVRLGQLYADAPAIYETALSRGEKALVECHKMLVPSKQTLLVLQVITTLVILLPHHYVGQFYCLVQLAMGFCTTALASFSWFPASTDVNDTKKLTNHYYSDTYDDEVPGVVMVKSPSMTSLCDLPGVLMVKSPSTTSLCDHEFAC
ncbi:TBC1 domain family member 20 [Seminavis robusta]|uniref:TBC1 domain family member 20 n=1 Tax=Seminavis robusta TaxID=568900 RepID=A0A9N8HNA1_9STRA|nr:TBC1 domain family member 20 [Seminavis robusta]|eukprot:Sro975_g226770.1 TBC1 domain family member 20 (532) ;mRNA; r:12980-14751